MTYIENIFVCIAAPLIVTALCMGRKHYRVFFFCLAGMTACLLSAYINTFFARLYNADLINATTQIAPVVEEIMKLLPLLFYLLIFEPKPEKIDTAVLIVAASFATFENICYLTQNGASQLSFLLIRGFGTGAMHIICGAVVGYGLVYVWPRGWLRIAGTAGLLSAAIIFHAVYNLLIAYGGHVQYIAYALPVLTIVIRIGAGRLLRTGPQA
jgi:RsiW-degrading membrane proteinase PrsW (M82 family)